MEPLRYRGPAANEKTKLFQPRLGAGQGERQADEKQLSQAKLGDPFLNLAIAVLLDSARSAQVGDQSAARFLESQAAKLFFDALGMDENAGMRWLLKGMPGRVKLRNIFKSEREENQMNDQIKNTNQKGAQALSELSQLVQSLEGEQLDACLVEIGEILPAVNRRVRDRVANLPKAQAE
jgi:hypothetical protein